MEHPHTLSAQSSPVTNWSKPVSQENQSQENQSGVITMDVVVAIRKALSDLQD